MSYDISVWSIARKCTREEAIHAWEQWSEHHHLVEPLVPSARIHFFQRELEQNFPQLDALPEDQLDQSPWVCEFEPDGPTLTLSCVWSRAEEIASYIFDLAMKHNLAVFDFPTEMIYLPPELVTPTDCTLESPHLLKPIPAYPEIVPDLLDVLPGRSDPFLVAGRSPQIYVQTIWTEDGFILEYREGGAADHYQADGYFDAATCARAIQRYLTHGMWKEGMQFDNVHF